MVLDGAVGYVSLKPMERNDGYAQNRPALRAAQVGTAAQFDTIVT